MQKIIEKGCIMEQKSMEQNSSSRMGTAPLFGLIVKMSVPAMFSMLVQAMYNVVDSYFVGLSSASDKPLAALSLAFPIQNLIIAFAVGTAVGTSSLVARQLGQKRKESAESTAAHGLVLSFITSVIFAVAMSFLARGYCQMFESDPEIIEMGVSYLTINCVFSFGLFLEVMCEKILQSTGNMIWPMIFQLIGAVTNIILDPILIFGMFGLPAMGVEGAAIATVAGQILAMIVSFIVIATKEHAIKISFKGFRFNRSTVKNIYAVGLPTIIMQSIGTIMTMAMNGILAAYSTAAYTVFGLYFKLQSFVFMPVFGLNQGLMPIMAYNFGARNESRVRGALRHGMKIALGINTVGLLLFQFMPAQLLSIFSVSSETLAIGIPALRIISINFIPAAISITIGTLFQAVGKGVYSMINSILRQLAVLVPAAWIISKITGQVLYIWFSFPISETVALVASLLLFRHLSKTVLKSLSQKQPPATPETV